VSPGQHAVHGTAMGSSDASVGCPIMPTYAAPSISFVSGTGSWLTDTNGRRYLDLLSGLAVTSLGHAHPDVTAAIAAQAGTLVHVSNLYGTQHNGGVASTIDRLIGDGTPAGGQVFFCNSGAEANEAAIKLARKWAGAPAGRFVVLSAFGSFHGRTLAALHATGQPSKWEGFTPLPEGFHHAAWRDLDDMDRLLDGSVAAVLLESVQGEGGVNVADVGYFRGVAELCAERGALFMVDEVQTGLGRTGRWFGFQHLLDAGITPDVVTLAKALGNGVPIGACWARREVAAAFSPGDHGTTYGGQPLATAAAAAVLEVMQREDVCARASAAGAELTVGLQALAGVREVRGLGLLLAAELDVERLGRDSRAVASELMAHGIIVNPVTPTALRLAPSLLITRDEIAHAIDRIGAVL